MRHQHASSELGQVPIIDHATCVSAHRPIVVIAPTTRRAHMAIITGPNSVIEPSDGNLLFMLG